MRTECVRDGVLAHVAGWSAVSETVSDCENSIARLECLVKEAHCADGPLVTVTPARFRKMADCLQRQVLN